MPAILARLSRHLDGPGAAAVLRVRTPRRLLFLLTSHDPKHIFRPFQQGTSNIGTLVLRQLCRVLSSSLLLNIVNDPLPNDCRYCLPDGLVIDSAPPGFPGTYDTRLRTTHAPRAWL